MDRDRDAGLILFPFFGNNDLPDDDKGKKEVIKRLKMVAPKAEKSDVIPGIESYLSAEELMEIIQDRFKKFNSVIRIPQFSGCRL